MALGAHLFILAALAAETSHTVEYDVADWTIGCVKSYRALTILTFKLAAYHDYSGEEASWRQAG